MIVFQISLAHQLVEPFGASWPQPAWSLMASV